MHTHAHTLQRHITRTHTHTNETMSSHFMAKKSSVHFAKAESLQTVGTIAAGPCLFFVPQGIWESLWLA